jgi:hypothetical protein
MGDYNIDNTLLVNIYKALTYFFNTSYIYIAWAIRSSLKYFKDFNIAETF